MSKIIAVVSLKQKLLSAIFAEAKKVGMPHEVLREDVALNVIGKRLSEAKPQELIKVLEHIAGQTKRKTKPYPLTKKGLLEELTDAARCRWGEGYEKPLHAFINSHQPTVTHYRFLPVATLKAIKDRIKELNRQDGKEVIYAES